MAFFSNQGDSFPQAVGSMGPPHMFGIFGPGKISQGDNRAFHEGSLGFMPRLGNLRADQEGSLGNLSAFRNGSLGNLSAFRNGSLGEDCPSCPPCPGAEDSSGVSNSSESGSDASLAAQTPQAYHDGIFMAPEQTDGTLQAEGNGSLSGGGLGLPLYVNGRLVQDPITIHHGYLSGLGVDPDPNKTSTNTYLMYGGIAAVAVLGIYLLAKK